MIRETLFMILLLAGVTGSVYAQSSDKWKFTTKADATFNMSESYIHHRHKVWLGNGNTMTVELFSTDDYKKLQDLEAFLRTAWQDLSFIPDSISQCPQCSYRIDYSSAAAGNTSYRLQRFEPQGTFLFKRKDGAVMPFKSENDTLKFTLLGQNDNFKRAQVTFILNRYANLQDLLAQKGYLNSFIDTFIKKSAPRYREDKKWPWTYYSSIFMYKNLRDSNQYVIDYRPHLDKNIWDVGYKKPTFDILVNFGAGFMRDKLTPVGELGLMYRLPGTKSKFTTTIIGLYASGFFAFEKNDVGKFVVNDNWFLNAEIGDEGENQFTSTIKTSRLTVGAGYLISQKGNYFSNTTMKVFMNIRLKNGVTLTPEIIGTDNFKQVFPGLTVKIF